MKRTASGSVSFDQATTPLPGTRQGNALDGRPDDGQATHLGGEHIKQEHIQQEFEASDRLSFSRSETSCSTSSSVNASNNLFNER
jgi:hypothetical protein